MTGMLRSAGFGLRLVVMAVLAAGCAADPASPETASSAPPGGAVIVADHQAFDRAALAVRADRAFTLLFDNRDAAPHNVTVFDPSSGDVVYAGEIFGGPGIRAYALPALAPGAYRFRCDVHPDMSGALEATPG